jgi:hypothetical protein
MITSMADTGISLTARGWTAVVIASAIWLGWQVHLARKTPWIPCGRCSGTGERLSSGDRWGGCWWCRKTGHRRRLLSWVIRPSSDQSDTLTR